MTKRKGCVISEGRKAAEIRKVRCLCFMFDSAEKKKTARNKVGFQGYFFRGQHHRGGHLHPVSAIVKPMLEDRDDCKASMPDCKNVKKIAAILSM